ncbi:hypothetical protein LINGRAHAP2_LOCUS19930 [Linum grandiflorum]
MRIQVELDVRRPLKRTKKVLLHGEARVLCKYRYERLQSFCFICGIMGHTDKYCEAHFHFPADQIVRKWDDSIRVQPRNLQQQLAARWLGVQTNPAEDRQGYGSRRGRQLFPVAPRPIPANIQALAICGGASTMSANHPPAYSVNPPDEEEDLMEVGDDRKRRRAGKHRSEEERPTKSPTKPGSAPGEHQMTE